MVILIAAGSGITPIYHILLSIEAKQPIFPTHAILVYTAPSIDDLWLRTDLDTIARRSNGLVNVQYVSSKVCLSITGKGSWRLVTVRSI